MLPIIDYGSIAIVIPKVTAVGVSQNEKGKYCLEIFLSGTDVPILIEFDSEEEAQDAASLFNIEYGRGGRIYARVR